MFEQFTQRRTPFAIGLPLFALTQAVHERRRHAGAGAA
jgi:hypothetical protein